jgi:hypothetical protein
MHVLGIDLVCKDVETLQSLRLPQIFNEEIAEEAFMEVFDSVVCVRCNEIYRILDNVSLL